VFAVFGVSTIIGAVLEVRTIPEMTLPGIIVGAVWAVVGVKAGVPLIPTVSGQSHPDAIAAGLRRLIWRRRIVWLAAFALGGLCFFAVPRVPQEQIGILFFAVALPVASLAVISFLSGCPRCGKFFYPVGRLVSPFARLNRCQNCGLELRGGEPKSDAA
jgi:hypothetical protein